MDIRITGIPKIRVLPKREGKVPHAAPLFRAEAMAESAIQKIRPGLVWIFGLRRRLATISVLGLTVWLFVHVTFGANGMMVYRAKCAEVVSLQREIDSLQKENDRCRLTISRPIPRPLRKNRANNCIMPARAKWFTCLRLR
jgi:hypothetical protein